MASMEHAGQQQQQRQQQRPRGGYVIRNRTTAPLFSFDMERCPHMYSSLQRSGVFPAALTRGSGARSTHMARLTGCDAVACFAAVRDDAAAYPRGRNEFDRQLHLDAVARARAARLRGEDARKRQLLDELAVLTTQLSHSHALSYTSDNDDSAHAHKQRGTRIRRYTSSPAIVAATAGALAKRTRDDEDDKGDDECAAPLPHLTAMSRLRAATRHGARSAGHHRNRNATTTTTVVNGGGDGAEDVQPLLDDAAVAAAALVPSLPAPLLLHARVQRSCVAACDVPCTRRHIADGGAGGGVRVGCCTSDKRDAYTKGSSDGEGSDSAAAAPLSQMSSAYCDDAALRRLVCRNDVMRVRSVAAVVAAAHAHGHHTHTM